MSKFSEYQEPETTREDRYFEPSKPRTTAETLSDQINEDDGVFDTVETALVFYCESRGLNREDFEWAIDVVAKED